MKLFQNILIVIFVSVLFIDANAANAENDTLIMNVMEIVKSKIEKAKWLKNSVARADLFNIPVMVAVYEGRSVDVAKTDGQDLKIFNTIIANNVIDKALNKKFNRYDEFVLDTVFDEVVEKGRTDLYFLRNYVSRIDNKRKPVFIVASEILKKDSYYGFGKELQDSILVAMRTPEEVVKAEPVKKEKKKKKWYKRKKKKRVSGAELPDSLSLVRDTASSRDTVVEVFLGTDSVEVLNEDDNNKKTAVLFLLLIVIISFVLFISLFLNNKKE